MHLLVVEDDPRLGPLLERMLTEERHITELAVTGRDALEMAATDGFDAIVLDIGLPDMSGLDVCRRIRATRSSVPVLMLTARDTVGDRVTGLDTGADDYLVKPFSFQELSARLRALGRRAKGTSAHVGTRLENGPIALDDGKRELTVGGRRIDLTPREFALMECLLRHRGQVLSRDQLLDHAWPYGSALTPNAVDTYVHYLREKLGPDASRLIETVRGVGYRMAEA